MGKFKNKDQIKKDCIARLKLFALKNKIKSKNDWYKVNFLDLKKQCREYLKKGHMSGFKILTNIYPKYRFLPWLFRRVPKGIWKEKVHRVNYIKWLRKRLKIINLSEFYKIPHIDVRYKYYGSILAHSVNSINKQHSMYHLLKEAYPKYDWKFWLFNQSPSGIWKNKINQKTYFDWVVKKMKINPNSEEIYNIQSKDFALGNAALSHYKTFFDFIQEMVPDKKLNKFAFKYLSNSFWLKKKNQKEALIYLAKKLGFKKKNDWYGVTANDFLVNGMSGLMRYHEYSYPKAVTSILKKYQFDITKFDFSSKNEFRARCYSKCLFGKKEIKQNARINILKNVITGRNLEFDIWIPRYKIAIEYQGELHYTKGPQTKEQFRTIKIRDKWKKKIAKKNDIILIELKCKKWDGMPDTFIVEINKHYQINLSKKKYFWNNFKKDSLYKDILKEKKGISFFFSKYATL